MPPAIRTDWEHARPAFINFLTRDLSRVHGHSARDVAVSSAQPGYPVVILRAGGAGSALNYTSLAEDLASHGYVVVGLDLATTANPEQCAGRNDDEVCATNIMTPLIRGIGRATDHLKQLAASDARFKSKFDLTRLGIFGHSFGGSQAAQVCSQDPRCKAGINIDGRPFGTVIKNGIPVPFMFLLSDHGTPRDAVSERILSQIQAIYDRQPHDSRMRIVIRGAHHFTFSDDGALLKSAAFRGVLRALAGLRISGRRQVEVTAYAVRRFLMRISRAQRIALACWRWSLRLWCCRSAPAQLLSATCSRKAVTSPGCRWLQPAAVHVLGYASARYFVVRRLAYCGSFLNSARLGDRSIRSRW